MVYNDYVCVTQGNFHVKLNCSSKYCKCSVEFSSTSDDFLDWDIPEGWVILTECKAYRGRAIRANSSEYKSYCVAHSEVLNLL